MAVDNFEAYADALDTWVEVRKLEGLAMAQFKLSLGMARTARFGVAHQRSFYLERAEYHARRYWVAVREMRSFGLDLSAENQELVSTLLEQMRTERRTKKRTK